ENANPLVLQKTEPAMEYASVAEIAANTLKPVLGLREQPANHALIVVAKGQDVVQGGEAALLALFLHVFQLLTFELVVLNRAPIITRRVHGETGCEGAIHANDQGIVTGAAVPIFQLSLN